VLQDSELEKSLENGIVMGKQKISVRFRNINIALLLVASLAMGVIMLAAIRDVISQVSVDYARLYTSNTAGALGAHLNREIGLMAKAARSNSVREWFADEDDPEKKSRAHEEMRGVLSVLYSQNLYLGLEKTRHEFTIDDYSTADELAPRAKLDPDNPDDAWYFECLGSDNDYVLNVDVDKILHRKHVWLNYKVSENGSPLGVISSGLEFSKVAAELFSEYDNAKVRSLIIDADGVIHMDSSLLGHDDFLNFSFEIPIGELSSDPTFLAALKAYLGGIKGYFELRAKPLTFELSTGQYGYATIAPIVSTDWSVVTLYKSSSLFNPARLMPFFLTMVALFAAFVMVSSILSHRIILVPFEQLIRSLKRIKEDEEISIYGTERDDEFGTLSNTIQDLFTKAHYDVLTGIHNRRALEKNLKRNIEYISRIGGRLSLLMIDVDHFKKFNDTYGHEEGDKCLRSIATTLSGGLKRIDDFVGRYGGEEFVALLPGVDEQGARLVADRLRRNVQDLKIPHEKNVSGWVTISIGITTGQVAYTHNWSDYLKRADEALYMSKQNGRNQSTFLNFTAAHGEQEGQEAVGSVEN